MPNTLPWLLGIEAEPEAQERPDFGALCVQIEQILQAFPADTTFTLWLTLLSLFVADKLIDEVVRHTQRVVADLYFAGNPPAWPSFEQRMTGYLCGELMASAPTAGSATKTAVRRCCTPPAIAVSQERLIFREICARGADSGQ